MHIHILLVHKTYSSTYQAVVQIMSYVSQIHFFFLFISQLVLAKTQEKAASSLTEVTWLGKKVPVKSEKLRVGFVKLQQLEGELSRAEGGEAKMDVYERLLMECQDAMQMVRIELGPELVSTKMWTYMYV